MDSIMKPLVEFVGGRQAARTIHFIIAWAFVAFVLIHVFEVLISGVFNQLRGMITGYYKVDDGVTGDKKSRVDRNEVVAVKEIHGDVVADPAAPAASFRESSHD